MHLLKYHSLYLEEERREVVFRHNDVERKLPKAIGYDSKQKTKYLKAYEDFDSKIISKDQALDILTSIMEDYYGINYPLRKN